ncbi:MAG: adenylate/guanylate cyclase domain-containing protein, partial [Armatimonadota bacterium]|nr:adenylate/guanylate cyclase domain-containing protein [Armatimonadota bacterium]
MPNLPVGTVTLLFTDIQGSSDHWTEHAASFHPVLEEHNGLLREVASRWNGCEVDTAGDSFFLGFARATDAVQFAVEAQLALACHNWSSFHPAVNEVQVRMGMHTGEPLIGTHPNGRSGYFGPEVNRAARVGSAGSGGQVLLSSSTHALVRNPLSPKIRFLDLGKHRLKGVGEETLFQALAAGLPESFPLLKSLDIVPHNLPLQPTPFIGREGELKELRELLSKSRLLTLTGPGGTGKTRLCLQIAEENIDSFRDGCWFVPLEAITDPSLVPSTLAAALGVREARGEPLLETVKDYLRDKEMLLLLDNFEQVTRAAVVVSEILSNCPRVKVLVTTRRLLNIRGEQEYPVPPLRSP